MPRRMTPSVTAAALALAACGPAVGVGTAQTAAPSPPDSSRAAPAPADSAPAWLVADPAAKTATLALQVTHGPDGAALLNGHRQGELQIVVPLGWTVQWAWRNADSTSAHSLVVMVERE